MTTDEALLKADEVADSQRRTMLDDALVRLAADVRQQHADLADLRRRLDRALMALATRGPA